MPTRPKTPARSSVPAARSVVTTVRDLLVKHHEELVKALPQHLSAERLARVALTAIHGDERLQECSVPSLLRAVIECAQLGLEPDGVLGHAYLVPRYNGKRKIMEAHAEPGYRGFIALAIRSGTCIAMDSSEIREHDLFEHSKGSSHQLRHTFGLTEPRGEIIGAWAQATLRGPGNSLYTQHEVLGIEEIEKARSASAQKDRGPWVEHYAAMARKTAIRRLGKYLVLSPEFTRAVQHDELVSQGLDSGLAGRFGLAGMTEARLAALRERHTGASTDAVEEMQDGTTEPDDQPRDGPLAPESH